jgi:hypothetical protein
MAAQRSSSPRANDVTPLLCTRGHVSVSTHQNISIIVWVAHATVPAVQCLQEVSKTMIVRYPNGHSSVSFVLDGVGVPTPDAQVVLQRSLGARSQPHVTAIVLEGSGFWASGLRGMISNSHREAQAKSALKITTSIDSLVGWFCEEHGARTGVELAPMALRDVLQHARQIGETAAHQGWEAS